MRVIPPMAVTAAILTSSTVAEPGVGETAWAAGTTYALGDKAILGAPSATVTITIAAPAVVTWTGHGLSAATAVILTTTGALPTGLVAGTIYYVLNPTANTFQLSALPADAPIVTSGSQSGTHTATAAIHRIYQSLVASNVGNPPLISPTQWLDIGSTSKWAMFDLLRNTATSGPSPLTVVITPGVRIDSVAAIGVVADSITVDLSVSGVSKYNFTQSLSTRATTTWYTYFFGVFSFADAIARFDLPPFTNAVITVTFTRATGPASCGGLVLGTSAYLGRTLHQAQSDVLNFSTISRDAFGNSILIPRRNVPKTNQQVRCMKTEVDAIRDARDALNAIPALWSGLDDQTSGYFGALLILGIYKQFTIDLDQPNEALVTLQLEEV